MAASATERFEAAAIECGALRLDGPFTLKSGKTSPYFFDTSRFHAGRPLEALADAYAAKVVEKCGEAAPDIVFGPAYKGIPLAVACALALSRNHGVPAGFLFDRKEAKTHGEGSQQSGLRQRLVGQVPVAGNRIVLLDDVLTTAGTKLEAIELLKTAEAGVEIVGLVVALDRQEPSPEGGTMGEQFTAQTGVPLWPLLTASEVLARAGKNGGDA